MSYPKTSITIALVSNSSWSLYNFRLGLIRKLISLGYRVLTIAPPDPYCEILIGEGCLFEPVPIDPYGTQPLRDLSVWRELIKLYKKHRPDLIFHYTVKPNIYGSLAASHLNIPAVAVITGLGQLFTRRTWKTGVANLLYRLSLRKAREVWFLNESDASILTEKGIVPGHKVRYLPGEGINTRHFQQYAYGLLSNGAFKFLFAGRLLIEKGLRDYVEAARIFSAKGLHAEFQVLGFVDEQNPHGISREEIGRWEKEGVIRYLGPADDVRPYLEKIDCLVLPSYYREGVPRTLMEGASMQIPLIATDNVGCRMVVEDGVNGFLCRPRDPEDLARCMEKMFCLPVDRRARFGLSGRRRVFTLFNEKIIINKYLRAIGHLLDMEKGAQGRAERAK